VIESGEWQCDRVAVAVWQCGRVVVAGWQLAVWQCGSGSGWVAVAI
jgi:hypothetical protein